MTPQSTPDDHRFDRHGYAPIITLSVDGYIRLSFESFRWIRMVHCFSGLDNDMPASSQTTATTITGFTEWISETTPAITIGWDWLLKGAQGAAQLSGVGRPGCNLMFLTPNGEDIGFRETEMLLQQWLQTFDWQTPVLQAVST